MKKLVLSLALASSACSSDEVKQNGALKAEHVEELLTVYQSAKYGVKRNALFHKKLEGVDSFEVLSFLRNPIKFKKRLGADYLNKTKVEGLSKLVDGINVECKKLLQKAKEADVFRKFDDVGSLFNLLALNIYIDATKGDLTLTKLETLIALNDLYQKDSAWDSINSSMLHNLAVLKYVYLLYTQVDTASKFTRDNYEIHVRSARERYVKYLIAKFAYQLNSVSFYKKNGADFDQEMYSKFVRRINFIMNFIKKYKGLKDKEFTKLFLGLTSEQSGFSEQSLSEIKLGYEYYIFQNSTVRLSLVSLLLKKEVLSVKNVEDAIYSNSYGQKMLYRNKKGKELLYYFGSNLEDDQGVGGMNFIDKDWSLDIN